MRNCTRGRTAGGAAVATATRHAPWMGELAFFIQRTHSWKLVVPLMKNALINLYRCALSPWRSLTWLDNSIQMYTINDKITERLLSKQNINSSTLVRLHELASCVCEIVFVIIWAGVPRGATASIIYAVIHYRLKCLAMNLHEV